MAAPHVDALRLAHAEFLAAVQAQCLLHPAARPALAAVRHLLAVARRFAQAWAVATGSEDTLASPDDALPVTGAMLAALSAELGQCCRLLRNALRAVLRGGGHAHLVPLLELFESMALGEN